MANELRTTLALDISNYVAEMQRAGKTTATESEKMQRTIGYIDKSLKEIAKNRDGLTGLASAHKAAGEAAEVHGKATAGMTRELLIMSHELSQGNFKRFGGSMLVLAEYSESAKTALAGMVGPVGLVVAGLAAVGVEIAKGAYEAAAFNKMLIATGNYAGLTAGKLDELAASAAKHTNSPIGSAREAATAVAATGRFGPSQINGVTEATLRLQKVTGQSAEEIAADFAKMGEGVAKWALKHNETWHFLSTAQYTYIRQLEEMGDKEGAQAVVTAAVNDRFKEQERNLGSLARAYRYVTESSR